EGTVDLIVNEQVVTTSEEEGASTTSIEVNALRLSINLTVPITGTEVLTADIVIAHSEASMTCEEQVPDAGESTLGAPDPASVPADGTSTSTLTVTVEDTNGVAIIDLEESDF